MSTETWKPYFVKTEQNKTKEQFKKQLEISVIIIPQHMWISKICSQQILDSSQIKGKNLSFVDGCFDGFGKTSTVTSKADGRPETRGYYSARKGQPEEFLLRSYLCSHGRARNLWTILQAATRGNIVTTALHRDGVADLQASGEPFNASITLYQRSDFREPHPPGKLLLPLGTPLFVLFSVDFDNSVRPLVEECYTTKSSSADDPDRQYLIRNRWWHQNLCDSGGCHRIKAAWFALTAGAHWIIATWIWTPSARRGFITAWCSSISRRFICTAGSASVITDQHTPASRWVFRHLWAWRVELLLLCSTSWRPSEELWPSACYISTTASGGFIKVPALSVGLLDLFAFLGW